MLLDAAAGVASTHAVTDMAAIAREAEDAGYHGLWVAEAGHDPFIALALAATSTSHIALGTAIAVAFARNPMTLATTANDLHLVSRGRFTLGLGSQVKAHITKRYSMPWSHPAPRMRELVLAVRAIWHAWSSGVPVSFRGEFYTHTLSSPFFDPGPNPFGHPPIYLAAVGERMTEVAGEVADGLLVHPFTTPRYLSEVSLPALERGAQRAGASRTERVVALSGFCVTGTTDQEMDESARAAKAQLAFYASTPAYRPVLELHGWGELQRELHARARSGRWDTMGDLVDDTMLDTFAVVAPAASLADALRARWGGLVDRFSFYATPPAAVARSVLAALES